MSLNTWGSHRAYSSLALAELFSHLLIVQLYHRYSYPVPPLTHAYTIFLASATRNVVNLRQMAGGSISRSIFTSVSGAPGCWGSIHLKQKKVNSGTPKRDNVEGIKKLLLKLGRFMFRKPTCSDPSIGLHQGLVSSTWGYIVTSGHTACAPPPG